jgi:hypothetical protein
MRDVLLFRLRFGDTTAELPTSGPPEDAAPSERVRDARPFREEPPTSPSSPPGEAPDPEILAAKREQASRDHHSIVSALNMLLREVECTRIEELPDAIDLWATRADGSRMIFEAKTVSPSNELSQTRSGLRNYLSTEWSTGRRRTNSAWS